MPEPVALVIAGMAMSAYSAMAQGAAARKQHKFQAAMIDRERQREKQIGALKASQAREKNTRLQAQQAALMAGRGGDPGAGSHLLLVEDLAEQGELNARLIEDDSEHKVTRMGDEMALQGMLGRNKQRAGLMKAGTALLSGAQKMYTG